MILRHRNDDEILPLVEFARSNHLDLCFIEEMPLAISMNTIVWRVTCRPMKYGNHPAEVCLAPDRAIDRWTCTLLRFQ